VSDEGREAFLITRHVASSDLWRLADDPSIRDRMAEQTQKIADRGVFGAPTFFVDDEMFFGNDRLDFVKTLLRTNREAGGAS
jgi:2-hydroxychromene-2-carboxylate isomerase